MLHLFRDPVSGLTHLFGAFLGVAGLAFMLARYPAADAKGLWSMLVYGISMILLYGASAAYHLPRVSDARRAVLRRIDHAMVPVFIAGSYTPFCVVGLGGAIGYGVLITVWTAAIAGLFKSIYWLHAPRWATAGLYVAMGWIIVLAIYPLSQAVSTETLWLIIAGGVAYTAGAVIYATKRPNPWPPHFGFHEIWHLFVLAGSALHFASILTLFGA